MASSYNIFNFNNFENYVRATDWSLAIEFWLNVGFQKQSLGGVLRKSSSEKFGKIHKKIPP